jgi:hypothetical protein
MRGTAITMLVIAACFAPGVASAQSSNEVAAARAQLRHEPTVAETVRICLRYFRVDPDNFDGLRSAAKGRAWLPTLAAGYRLDDVNFARVEQTLAGPTLSLTQTNDEDQAQFNHAITVGAIWDLRELIFNPAEVQVYGLIGVQRDLMLEVTRTFYLRRQLMLRLMLRPPEDPLAYAALEMRVDEFTAVLDVLTDGWFSDETSDRRDGRVASR